MIVGQRGQRALGQFTQRVELSLAERRDETARHTSNVTNHVEPPRGEGFNAALAAEVECDITEARGTAAVSSRADQPSDALRCSASGLRSSRRRAGERIEKRHEHALERVRFDRLLQQRDVGVPAIDAVALVAGQEDERHAVREQEVGERLSKLACKIEVEEGAVETLGPRSRKPSASSA